MFPGHGYFCWHVFHVSLSRALLTSANFVPRYSSTAGIFVFLKQHSLTVDSRGKDDCCILFSWNAKYAISLAGDGNLEHPLLQRLPQTCQNPEAVLGSSQLFHLPGEERGRRKSRGREREWEWSAIQVLSYPTSCHFTPKRPNLVWCVLSQRELGGFRSSLSTPWSLPFLYSIWNVFTKDFKKSEQS